MVTDFHIETSKDKRLHANFKSADMMSKQG